MWTPASNRKNVLTMDIALDFVKYNTDDKQRAFFETLLDKVQAQSGVKSAAASMMIPFTADMTMTSDFQIQGQASAPGQALPKADFRIVSPSYFEALHIPILNGRAFLQTDRPETPIVAVVNRSAARHLWGLQDPIGTRFSTDAGEPGHKWLEWSATSNSTDSIKMWQMRFICRWHSTPWGRPAWSSKQKTVEPMSIARGVIELLHGRRSESTRRTGEIRSSSARGSWRRGG